MSILENVNALEKAVLLKYVEGEKTGDIAKALNRRHRIIDYTLEEMKTRFNCSTRNQLIALYFRQEYQRGNHQVFVP